MTEKTGIEIDMRWCINSDQWHRNKSATDGWQVWCKDCNKKYSKQYH